jgi:phosphomethylpyrimidine synthase
MCGPKFCSMKISPEVREFARLNPMPQNENPDRDNAVRGMEEMSRRFQDEGGELYVKAD